MKRALLMIAIVVFSPGCSSYRATSFDVTSEMDLLVTGDTGELLQESELIGRPCKVELRDGSIVEGEITKIDQQSITLKVDTTSSALEATRKESITIMKTQVADMTLQWHSSEKSFLLGIGLTAAVVVVGYFAALAFSFRNYN